MREKDYAGCCGLYCGLCPRFQSNAPSRCLGCQLGEQHSYCSVYRCCVTKRGHFSCAECEDFPCERLIRVLGVEEGLDSFVSHKPALPNLERIREIGLDAYLEEQRERRLLAEELLANFNEGRSMSFYCTACALLPQSLIHKAMVEAQTELAGMQADISNMKTKAKAMRAAIERQAIKASIDLKLRKRR